MERKEFSVLYLSRLKLDDLFALFKSSIAYAEAVQEMLGAMLLAVLAKFKTDHHTMEQQINKALKNALTPLVNEKNADREDRFAEIKRNITTALKGRNAEKKSAAEQLKNFMEPFWDTNLKALNTQTGLYSDMLEKIDENEMLAISASTIGISDMLEGLAVSNNAFDTVYQIRLTQESAEGPSATSLRTTATDSYNQFCMALEQTVNFMPSEPLENLFNQLDELRKTYARLIHTEEEPEPEPTAAPAE